MRKLIVKNFALDYMFNFFGTTYNAPRASRIIFPLFFITGLLNAFNEDWPNPTFLIWVIYLLDAIAVFFGFIYFHIYPVRWEELDNFQKFQFGLFKFDDLTKAQRNEFYKIEKEYN